MHFRLQPVTFHHSKTGCGSLNSVRFASGRKKPVFATKKSRSLSPYVGLKGQILSSQRNNLVKSATSVVPKALDTGKFGQLSEVNRSQRDIHKNLLENVSDFNALKLDPSIREAILNGVLKNLLGTKKPTPIQVLATKMIRKTRTNPNLLHSWLLAAETGSGKTLAYLAPLLSKLKEFNATQSEEESAQRGIKFIILVPSNELAKQTASVLHELAMITPFKYARFSENTRIPQFASRVKESLDVLVCTPAKLLWLFGSKFPASDLASCQSLVVDEADTLLDKSFEKQTNKAIAMCHNITDLVFCSATIPRSFDKIMRKDYPAAERIVTPNIHKMPSHVDFRVIEVFRPPYLDNKELALLQALYAIYHENKEEGLIKRVVIFLNKRTEVPALVELLKSKDYDVSGITKHTTTKEREAILNDFVGPAKPNPNQTPTLQILVATDIVARGVDMNNIKNVILYDLPYSSTDLLHRVGRTGRLNKRGRVLLLVGRKESESWIKGLQKAVNQGLALA